MNQTFTNEKTKTTGVVQYLFSKTSAFTLSCSLAAMTLFVLLRTLVSALDSHRLNELKAVYYFVGDSDTAVGIVNFIFGVIACAILFFMSLGMFKGISSSKNGHSENLLKSTKFLSVSLVSAIFFTAVITVSSFASSSLINYQNYWYSNYRSVGNENAGGLFFTAILFGALSLTLEIALTRLVLAFQRTLKSGFPEKQGSALAIVISSLSAVVMTVTFLIMLARLVLPDSSAGLIQRRFAGTLTMNTINVLLAGAVTVIFVTLVIGISVYVGLIENLKRSQNTRIYNNLFADNPLYQNPFSDYPSYYDTNPKYSKVFPAVPEDNVLPVSPKNELSFEIPHTEYPTQNSSVKDSDSY